MTPAGAWTHRLLPFLRWWPMVTAQTLRADLIAGLVGALIVIPQGVAFATLAGMPPEYGLYLAMVPAVVAALWGSSWHAVSGPTTAISLLVFATLAPLATPGSPEYVRLALTLSFMAGAMMIALGVARLGGMVNFVSHTVVVGFTAGAGLLIVASQLRNFFGVDLPRGLSFLETIWAFIEHAPEAKPFVMTVAVVTLLTGLAARRWLKKVPYMVVALLAGSLFAYALTALLGAEETGIVSIGQVPSALPPLSAPHVSLETIRQLFGIAASVTVLGLAEAISIARALALRSGQRIDANQEFIGQGLSNIAASFFSGYPSSASLNRSGLNLEAGARSPLAAALSAPILVAVLLAVAPLIAFIPLAVMAAILLLVGWGLIDFPAIRRTVRMSRTETLVLAVTFASTLTMSLEIAVLMGVLVSLVAYLYRTSHPVMRSLVPDTRHPERKMTGVEAPLVECPQLKILRIEGSIYFGAVNHVATHFETLRAVSPGQKHLLLMAKSINFVDMAGADLLAHEADVRRAGGGQLYFYSLRQPVRDMLERGGQLECIGRDNVFVSKDEAISKVFARLDRSVCRRCAARIFLECGTLPAPSAEAQQAR
jgi:SulP family sulfate permease